MTGQYSTSVDLAGFAPQVCENGHDMRMGDGRRAVSTFPCSCPGIRADPQRRRFHVKVTCCACGAAYHDPPHVQAD